MRKDAVLGRHLQHRRGRPLMQLHQNVSPPVQRLIGPEQSQHPLLVRSHENELSGRFAASDALVFVDQAFDRSDQQGLFGILELTEPNNSTLADQVIDDMKEPPARIAVPTHLRQVGKEMPQSPPFNCGAKVHDRLGAVSA